MSYFICAWVNSGQVSVVESSMEPIVSNSLPEYTSDFRVVAEVSGNYKEAEYVRDNLTVSEEKLVGLSFISQTVLTRGA